jgi:phospholipid/cholesterol/gamma-HCH transport system substrate-binding protein
METRANFIAVGLFVIALFMSLLIFVVWLSNWQAERSYKEYWIFFDGSVKGLRVGSSVTFRGITVGEVTFIGFPDDGNVERILVKTRIEDDAPVRTDTVASLEIQGLAGGALVMLKGGSNAATALDPGPGQAHPVISSAPSELDRLLAGAPALVEQVQELVARARIVLGDDNQAALTSILKNVSTLSATLADRSQSIESIVDDAKGTLAQLRQAAGSVQSVGAALEKDVPAATREAAAALRNIRKASKGFDGFIKQARTTARSFEGAADQAGGMIKENRRSIRDFTGTTLYDLNAFLSDSRILVDNLNRLTTEVGRDPARFLFGGQQRGYQTR